jgi:hypothetical protein
VTEAARTRESLLAAQPCPQISAVSESEWLLFNEFNHKVSESEWLLLDEFNHNVSESEWLLLDEFNHKVVEHDRTQHSLGCLLLQASDSIADRSLAKYLNPLARSFVGKIPKIALSFPSISPSKF